ncbi:MAG: hypothetical protein ACYC9L_07550 [Sulfuricaulis sp.]
MTDHLTPEEIAARLKTALARSKHTSEENQADTVSLVQQDIARLICAIVKHFSHLVIKRGELALIIATRGDLHSLTVTLELVRHRQRVAYFSYSDPVLRIEGRTTQDCMAAREGKNILRTRYFEGSLPNLLAMRALLYTKLPVKSRNLMPSED